MKRFCYLATSTIVVLNIVCVCPEKLAASSTQGSSASIPYVARTEIKTENIQPEPSKGESILASILYLSSHSTYICTSDVRRYTRETQQSPSIRAISPYRQLLAVGKSHLSLIDVLSTTGYNLLYHREQRAPQSAMSVSVRADGNSNGEPPRRPKGKPAKAPRIASRHPR